MLIVQSLLNLQELEERRFDCNPIQALVIQIPSSGMAVDHVCVLDVPDLPCLH